MGNTVRGDGTTTRQMQEAPMGAVFIWVAPYSIHYAKRLARSLGRDDLRIEPPSILTSHRLRGMELPGIVVDHACRLDDRQLGELVALRQRIAARAA